MSKLNSKRLWTENKDDIIMVGGVGSAVSAAWLTAAAVAFGNPLTLSFFAGHVLLGGAGWTAFVVGARHYQDIQKLRKEIKAETGVKMPFMPIARAYLREKYTR